VTLIEHASCWTPRGWENKAGRLLEGGRWPSLPSHTPSCWRRCRLWASATTIPGGCVLNLRRSAAAGGAPAPPQRAHARPRMRSPRCSKDPANGRAAPATAPHLAICRDPRRHFCKSHAAAAGGDQAAQLEGARAGGGRAHAAAARRRHVPQRRARARAGPAWLGQRRGPAASARALGTGARACVRAVQSTPESSRVGSCPLAPPVAVQAACARALT
jgi:hypothetical protein